MCIARVGTRADKMTAGVSIVQEPLPTMFEHFNIWLGFWTLRSDNVVT